MSRPHYLGTCVCIVTILISKTNKRIVKPEINIGTREEEIRQRRPSATGSMGLHREGRANLCSTSGDGRGLEKEWGHVAEAWTRQLASARSISTL